MSAAYKLTELAAARPGMALSEDLLDRQGQVLLPKGAVLTAAMLASLGRHDVEMLPLVTGGETEDADPGAIQARLDHLFRRNERDNDDDWATGILRRYVEDYRLAREVAP
ncbi:MAG: hypothetical protein ACJ8LG_20235 [Massilia sp.]